MITANIVSPMTTASTVSMTSMDSIAAWVCKMCDPAFPFHTLDEGLEISETSSDSCDCGTDSLCVDPLQGWGKKDCKSEGMRDKEGRLCGKVWVGVGETGGEFKGYVEEGKREGECVVTCPKENIRMLKGSYYNDKPEGFVVLEREDGSLREGFCIDGRWDGLVREFDDDRVIRFIGRYKNGEPVGSCWLRMKGGGFLVGSMDCDWRMNTENGAYIYPDYSTAYTGSFRAGEMLRGRACIVEAWEVTENMMKIKVTKVWGPERSYREATEECLSSYPLEPDPYEERWIECKQSSMAGGGEGIFARKDIPAGTLVALYNGLKQPPLAPGARPDDWDLCGYSIGYYESTTSDKGWGDLDIPAQFRDLAAYRATLAHKMNHSFQNNCSFSDMVHPIYGYIPCTVTTKEVREGEELFVHYHYSLDDCPAWYEELYNNL